MIVTKDLIPFTLQHVKNKTLIIQMLSWEEEFQRQKGNKNYTDQKYKHLKNGLELILIMHRKTLMQFGFNTSDESVANYREIFRTYFHSPNDYDKDVINASFYMRYNRCVFYQNKPLKKGEVIPDATLLQLTNNNTKNVQLYDIIRKLNGKYTLIAAFSLS